MKQKILIFIFALFAFFNLKTAAHAEKIDSFDVDIVAHKDGMMDVTETIQYNFEYGDRHGIFRYIPLSSRVGDLYRVIKIENVKVERNGEEENFETTKSKEQIYFKIGNANKEISGKHTYKISYTVANGIGSNYETHDEIYWNVTGNDWQVPIEKASVNLTTDFNVSTNRVACFTRDTTFNAQFCIFPPGKYNPVTITNTLNPGEGLTVVYGFPANTFPKSTLLKELPKSNGEKIAGFILKNLGIIYLIINIFIPSMIFFWYKRFKNKKRFGKPAVNFDIPKNEEGERLAPALAGTIDTARLERDDVVATLFDLAIRKYIKLEEIKNKKSLAPDKVTQKIIKLKEKDNKLSKFEEELYDRLFQSGNEVDAQTLKKDFYKTYSDMEESIFKSLVEKKYYVKNPKVQRGLLLVFGIMAIFTSNIILGVVLIYLSRKLIGRTALGDELDFKIDGLKLFLKSMDRNYKWQAEKFYTVEAMIPYAMSLGYIDKFMEQLKLIKPDYNPTWYHGYNAGFYHSYGSFLSGMSSNMTTSAPSSSSGFSGGSSGGGGGGGGGGSW
ncbi:MAG: DUF2207 domain-containing protein [Candidatus Levybacteria bacterium]|nr:DUF2207 domain-containing protein [Candidatus Levybacteria bacterium]